MLKTAAALLVLLGLLHADGVRECRDVEPGASRIYGASPPVTYLLYALDPALMAGLNFPLRDHERPYMSKAAGLPVIGGWFGQGRTPNMEVLAKTAPELCVAWNYRGSFGRIASALDDLGLASCALNLDTLDDYPEAFRVMGRVAAREARGAALADDFTRRLDAAAARLKGHENAVAPRVYYAEGVDGLKTECSGSVHAELIERVGGVNVHRCESFSRYGMEQIGFEQLLIYDPDVIVAFEPQFYATAFKDTRFAKLRAVREGRVYLIPNAPVNWFDRPPSFMRITGLEWLDYVLWGGREESELIASVQGLFALYFGLDMDPDALRGLMNLQPEGGSR